MGLTYTVFYFQTLDMLGLTVTVWEVDFFFLYSPSFLVDDELKKTSNLPSITLIRRFRSLKRKRKNDEPFVTDQDILKSSFKHSPSRQCRHGKPSLPNHLAIAWLFAIQASCPPSHQRRSSLGLQPSLVEFLRARLPPAARTHVRIG